MIRIIYYRVKIDLAADNMFMQSVRYNDVMINISPRRKKQNGYPSLHLSIQ